MNTQLFKADVVKAVRQAISKLDRSVISISKDNLWQLTRINSVHGPVGTNAGWVARQVFDEIVSDHPYTKFVF